MDIKAVADDIWQDLEAGRHMPARWAGRLSLEEAYAVQLAILDRHIESGERQAGWKVGLTARAMREQQGVFEPCFGFLLESGARPSGHHFTFGDLIAPGFENELCLTVGSPLHGPDLSPGTVRAAITHAAPALEIVEKRGNLAGGLPLAMADNAQQKAFVTGDPIPLTADNGDLGRSEVSVHLNGRLAERASGTNVMDAGPLLSVAWLAGKLCEYGRGISAGQRIMSGSFTRQYAIGPGDAVRAEFTPFGTVEAFFD